MAKSRSRSRSKGRSHSREPVDEEIDLDKLHDLRRDPQVRKVLDLMYEEDCAERRDRQSGRNRRYHTVRVPPEEKRGKHRKRVSKGVKTGPPYQLKVVPVGKSTNKLRYQKGGTKLKSPSDVTLYTPALRKDKTVASSPTLNHLALLPEETRGRASVQSHESLIDQLSGLVDKFRLDRDQGRNDGEGSPQRSRRGRSRSVSRPGPSSDVDGELPPRTVCHENNTVLSDATRAEPNDLQRKSVRPEVEEGRRAADQLILEAEKFKASVQPPKGNDQQFTQDDDEFFHLSCHIDANLKKRIENGEFVELDRLLPKNRTQLMKEEQPLQQFVNKDGSTYWAPPDRDSKITNVRRWEQAFRVYAAVYTTANPSRTAEIWQYIYVDWALVNRTSVGKPNHFTFLIVKSQQR